MSFEIELQVSTTKKYNPTSEDIADIVDDYSGDVDAWASDNIDLFIDDDYCIDKISYDKNTAIKLVNNMSALQRERILNADSYLIDKIDLSDYVKVDIDVKDLEMASVYSGSSNPKAELNGVYMRGCKMIATDTRRLIELTTKNNLKDRAFIPIFFIDLIINGGQLYIKDSKGIIIVVVHDNRYYHVFMEDFKYINIAYILRDIECVDSTFIKNSISEYMDGSVETAMDNGNIVNEYEGLLI